MSQNDFVIDNQTTPLFRADLNNALQALASNSSGPTQPTTRYANQWWYDESTDILKFRSEANDAWINVGTFNQSTNTFNPAGLVKATPAQSQAGTGAGLMDPVLTKAAIDAQVPSFITPPTTNQVLSATAGAGAGVTGSYGFFRAQGLTVAFGGTVGGASLNPAGSNGTTQTVAIGGTWMCLGRATAGSASGETTVFLRIS